MNGSSDDIPVQNVRVMQITALSLVIGLVMFLAMVLFLSQGQPAAASAVISFLSAGFLGISILLSLVLPGILTKSLLRQIAAESRSSVQRETPTKYDMDAAKLINVRQRTMIVVLALLEGAGFFGCIAYLVERQTFTLGVVGVAIFFMLLNFPTFGRVRTWLERHLVQLADLRQTGDQGMPR